MEEKITVKSLTKKGRAIAAAVYKGEKLEVLYCVSKHHDDVYVGFIVRNRPPMTIFVDNQRELREKIENTYKVVL